MEVASTVWPYKGEPRASNEDFDKDWQDYNKKLPLLNA